MGFSRKRIGRDGKPRYTAYYLDIRGQERSAGTFPNKKDANDAWKKAEGTVSGGKPGDPSRGQADLRSLRTGQMAASSPAGTRRPLQLRRAHPQPPAAVLRADEDA